jgi:hypothetical protein
LRICSAKPKPKPPPRFLPQNLRICNFVSGVVNFTGAQAYSTHYVLLLQWTAHAHAETNERVAAQDGIHDSAVSTTAAGTVPPTKQAVAAIMVMVAVV